MVSHMPHRSQSYPLGGEGVGWGGKGLTVVVLNPLSTHGARGDMHRVPVSSSRGYRVVGEGRCLKLKGYRGFAV